MKKIFSTLFIVGLFSTQQIFAQATEDSIVSKYNLYPRNLVKLNLFSLPLKNISVQYERMLTKKMSVALGFRWEPKSSIPFQSSVRSLVKENDETLLDLVNNTRVSNWALTPEFRYYLGKKPQNGFYIAPFVRIGGFGFSWPYTFVSNGNQYTVDFKGSSFAYSGGILFGAQWHIRKRFLIDWWLLGPAYGSQSAKLTAHTTPALPEDAQNQLRNDLNEDLKKISKSFNATVDNNGVVITGSTMFGGLRTGLCVGYTFGVPKAK